MSTLDAELMAALMLQPAVKLCVNGRPAPKGSRVYRAGGSRPASRYEKAWTETVAFEALATAVHLDPPYYVGITFRYARPVKPTHAWPSSIDLDKAVRGTLDGLVTGRLIVDDRHVVQLWASQRFATVSGADITVQSVPG